MVWYVVAAVAEVRYGVSAVAKFVVVTYAVSAAEIAVFICAVVE